MIFELPDSSTRDIAKTLVRIRDTGGQVTTSRVLSLIVIARKEDDVEAVIRATNEASREHPSRVIVLIQGDPTVPSSRLDAEVRIGGDAGASELILINLDGEVANNLVHVVTPLLLPDTPIVTWWAYAAPVDPSSDPMGIIAQRRITDSLFDPPQDALYNRRNHYVPGDSDIAWARLTPWRGVLASTLDQPPHEMVQEVRVVGPQDSPSVDLAAGWLIDRLGVPVSRLVDEHAQACDADTIPVNRVELDRPSGTVVLEVLPDQDTLSVTFPGKEVALVAISRRSTSDCLAEELRHLDPDVAYQRALSGLAHVDYPQG
ncbi:glucose-6-phosphate dehydrogenase assembly protein OpcA [Corynebacterium vitaeruminis]|uniref:Oxppcycle protein OpcA n=1 Tax=Corynebacterium vitaeruminis DSM 20294 TaxID=1224164 RepID=W5Y8S5_9CORY|nr:glucose-6-phosphate dehydrogenase assembly protein OpcA [Corynebacterium vitaeruminis]AHI22863.1 hypothetical protein B843_07390 [Corynebacterium vitaeruminis DSM 20294]